MFPPVDPTRRRFITVAAGASVASVGTLAVAAGGAVAVVAGIPTAESAETGMPASIDPIYAAIKRHKEAAVVWDAAVDVWAKFVHGPEPEPEVELKRINDAVRAARDALDDAAVHLINTAPTTLAGIARALNYIREQMVQKDSIYMPSGLVLKDDDDPEIEIIAWIDAFLDTIEHAASELDRAGKAVQS
jgi:hypothetical protein